MRWIDVEFTDKGTFIGEGRILLPDHAAEQMWDATMKSQTHVVKPASQVVSQEFT